MRRVLLISTVGLLGLTPLIGQLVISSFNSTGELTWTNSLASNANYRVEWSGSADGPWQKFDALTNLTLLSVTSNVVTVEVPTFYRVLWLDAPSHAGTWIYSGFDTNNALVVTGRFSLTAETNPVRGSWDFRNADGNATNSAGHPTGEGDIRQDFTLLSYLVLDLYPGFDFGLFKIWGDFESNKFQGAWAVWPGGTGSFLAVKQPVDP